MRQLLLFIMLLGWSGMMTAQNTIDLPDYSKGQYEFTPIYSYMGDFPFSGNGSVTFGGDLASNFVTGVEFKLIIDNIANPGSATYDTGSGSETMEVGDTLPVPVDMTANNGNVEFRVVIEGTPQVVGENYYCDLEFSFTTGNDWGMLIKESSTTTCQVDQSQGINDVTNAVQFGISPNPASDRFQVKMEDDAVRPSQIHMYQLDGTQVKSIAMEGTAAIEVESGELSAGIYLVEVLDENQESLGRKRVVIR